jgi:putative transposase
MVQPKPERYRKMAKKRRKFSSDFKARVALEAIKEREPLAAIAAKYEVHPNQISNWKKELLANAPGVFDGACGERRKKDVERQQSQLFEKIGRIEMENDWLRKKLGPYL